MLAPSVTHKIRQVIFLTITWVIANILIELHNAVNYDPVSNSHFLYFFFGRNGWEHLLITSVGPLIGGLTAGAFIVFYQREKLRGKTYGRKLLVHTMLYILFLSFCIGLVGVIGAMNNKVDDSFWVNFKNDVFSLRVLRLVIVWYFIVVGSVFLLDVSEKYGPGNMIKILLGKYHAPGKEERIFMFLDLKGSTTIAEQIGDETYFNMLHFFYHVANEAIINAHGEIYQYVGDEIIISWKKEIGLREANCLRCFAAIENAVEKHSALFTEKYGVVPQFKAGVHAGRVVTGEIGSVKKELVYSGDVLNTTARIVALCNQYGQKLIVSETIYEALKDNPNYTFTFLDRPVLRGKSVGVGIWGVDIL
jgi:adenylate cyclase